ncbi:MAG: hypothetical protein K1060chlam5_00351 [Candidatus Anoxychlamydiales bacterium]|nr:hypothetical protein [Candidatus Anoxychlamydiales bacterium]
MLVRFSAIFLFFFTVCFSDKAEENENELISSFKQSLLNRASKFLDKSKTSKPLKPHEIIVDLRNPSYKNGILTTHEGGVITGDDIRIQAKCIQYIKKDNSIPPVHKIEAEGDLIIQYKGRVYVGSELEYDFLSRTGTVYDGRTFASMWYLGGDKIELNPDGSYRVDNVFITTCENVDSTWAIHAGKVNVLKKDLLEAKKVRFRFFKFPTLWLPSFKVNLKRFFQTPLIRYNINWDKASGPRAGLRYRIYSWRDFALWARVEYRLKMGWGGAIEGEYYPENGREFFETKNYLASDIIPQELIKKRRYRTQGVYRATSFDKKTKTDITWDKYSDINMPGDFKSDDFELNTAKRTELTIRHIEDSFLSILYARPRLNTFNSVKQEFPTGYFNVRPFKLENLGFIIYNNFKGSYLNYSYSNDLSPSLKDFHSGRIEERFELSRPFKTKYISLIPYVGFEGIYFNNSPNHSSKTLLMCLYGGEIKTDFYRKYIDYKHIIQPYIKYTGITDPKKKIDSFYIFSIQDGYNELNYFKLGFKNQFYKIDSLNPLPKFETNLYANTFLDHDFTLRTLPKLYLDFDLNLSTVLFKTSLAWNFYKQILDYSNFNLHFTVNENLAFRIEFRHRSAYDFRKADHTNFILDVSRPISVLKTSSISDRRNTILTHAYFRLSPYWTCELQSHHGWARKNEPSYNEYRVDLYTKLSASWKGRLTYQHTQSDDKFSGSVDLIK